ncbi:hypothetical protein VF13_42795, partial [Nostoc linckia z16]
YQKKKPLQIFFGTILLALIFLAGQASLAAGNDFIKGVLGNIQDFNHYIFGFMLYAGVHSIYTQQELSTQTPKLLNVLEWLFIINTICIVAGCIFNINLFKSYLDINRFGYNGLLRNSTHASYIYMIYTLYFYYRGVVYNTRRYKWLLVFSFLSLFVIGTKSAILFGILLVLFHLLSAANWKFVTAYLGILTGLYFIRTFILENIVKEYYYTLYVVYRDRGLASMLFSLRNESFETFISFVERKWTLCNYFFGGAQFNVLRVEFELVDLFWFFGFIGGAIYLHLWFRYIFPYRLLLNLNFYFIILGIVLVSGSFFSSVPTITYLLVTNLYFLDRFAGKAERF